MSVKLLRSRDQLADAQGVTHIVWGRKRSAGTNHFCVMDVAASAMAIQAEVPFFVTLRTLPPPLRLLYPGHLQASLR